jgi:hypothetical protein
MLPLPLMFTVNAELTVKDLTRAHAPRASALSQNTQLDSNNWERNKKKKTKLPLHFAGAYRRDSFPLRCTSSTGSTGSDSG